MFILDYRIAFILLIFVPISFLITKKFEKKLYYNAGKNIKNSDQIKKFILDQKIISKEEKFSDYKQMTGFDKLLKNYNKDYKHSIVVKSSYLYFFSYTFLNFAILLVIFLSGYLTYVDILSIGSLFAFQNYTSQLWNPGEYLMSYNSNYQEVKPILNKINSILEIKNIEYIDKKINNIKLNNYCALDINNEELFNYINIEFKCGNIYLIKGENGIGKTTLIESILGFNNRYKGTISINDKINVKYNDFVYIPSTPYISEFYSEELSKASSGQKKIAQIKFYLQSSKSVYIIDEPTNFIDQDNKEEIINIILNKLNNDNIIIIISHDKSLEKISTDIIYLEKSSNTNLLQ